MSIATNTPGLIPAWSDTDDVRQTDILIIGAGQAGLALAHQLRSLPYRFLLVDRNARVGDSWRHRHDSLVLFTPRRYSALPGRTLPGDPEGFPTKDEVADYLEAYARQFGFPILHHVAVRSLAQIGDCFRLTTDDGQIIKSRAVVLANGAFQIPLVPALAAGFSPRVRQVSAGDYRRPSQLPPGNVLVVGDGATGRKIALDLAATHRTFVAGGRPRRILPERFLGRSLFWWMERLGLLQAGRDSILGRYARRTDPFPGRHLADPNLARHGVTRVGRLTDAQGNTARFEDGTTLAVDTVIWSVGFREDTSWIQLPEALDRSNQLIHHEGITPVPGLCLLGRSWQSSRGSALLLGVERDARKIAHHLDAWLGDPVDRAREGAPAAGIPIRAV